MNTNHRGLASVTVLLVVLGLIVLGGAGYVVANPQVLQTPTTDESMQTKEDTEGVMDGSRKGEKGWIELDSSTTISWRLTDTETNALGVPHTEVTTFINGKEYVVGTFQGTCSEIGASGGVDGKGLLAGELSAVQCWFAGGGDEIGVFAHEDGGYQIMVGMLEEPIEGGAGFRGDFKIKTDIAF